MTTQHWDARGYDADFSFITTYGAGALDLLDPAPGERVLDMGCGTGHQSAEIAARGAHVVGLDPDDAMLEVARRTYPHLTFVAGDAQQPRVRELRALAGGPYDAVFSNAALHWMPRQDDVVAGVAHLLRPGGRFVAEMGGSGNVEHLTAAIRAGRAAVGLDPEAATPWTFPTPAEQASRLERHGFTVRLVQLFERRTVLAAGSTAASWAAMFGAGMVADVPTERRIDFDAAVDERAGELGLAIAADGSRGWWGDYVRLRFHAEL